MDLIGVCGTGVSVIGIMIHEGYQEGSASCQANVSAGVHGSLSLGHRWGSSLTHVGDGVQSVFKTIIKTKRESTSLPSPSK